VKGIRIGELLALIAILLNVLCLFLWGGLRPTAKYEQAAFDRLEDAKKFNRKGYFEKAFAYYDDVANYFPKSKYAEHALFMAGRVALRGIGRIDLAEDRFQHYLKMYPSGKYVNTVRRYLDLIKVADGLSRERREAAIWELVQAYHEYEDGKFYEALNRCEWILSNFAKTSIKGKAQEIADSIRSQANQYYVAQANGQTVTVTHKPISLSR